MIKIDNHFVISLDLGYVNCKVKRLLIIYKLDVTECMRLRGDRI